ncbi:carboxypeptidase regulatory-like domain-containing protein, partial [bacterium]|nr:carboxypeptidase regulatory-like domain-containing protein [bacterium]
MKKSIGILTVLLFLFSGLAIAQEQTGNLEGKVTDNEGVPLPGVTVTAESPALIGTQSSITDQEGRFRLRNLPPGEYTLTFELSGFATVTRGDIQVRLGRTYTVDVNMKPATIEEEVTVVGETPVVDTKKSTSTFEIDKEMFTKLPKGRNFTSAITVSAGVTEESELAGMSFSGASSSENMFFVDGVNTTNMYGGTSGQNVTFEFIDEVQVKKAGYMAEYGGSMGGVVNVVTRSGGNEYHGQVLGYFESNSLRGEPRPSLRLDPEDYTRAEYITYPEDDWTRTELGFLLGGYLIKDRVWFFGSYIPKFQINNREVRFIQQPQVPKEFNRSRQWHQAQFKLTTQPFSSLRISASATTDYYQWRGELPSKAGTGNPDANYAGRGYNFPGWTAALHGNYVASDDLFFTFHAGRFRQNTESLTEAPGAWHYFIYTNKGMEGIPETNQRPSYWRSHQTYYTYDKDIRVKS